MKISLLVSDPSFYRTIESEEYAKNFEMFYDLLYSKEDSNSAFNMLEKFFPEDELNAINMGNLDLAKILLVAIDIHLQRDKVMHPTINDKLLRIFEIYNTENPDWNKIFQQYNEITSGE